MTPTDKTTDPLLDEIPKLTLKDRVFFWVFESWYRLFMWRGPTGFWVMVVTFALALALAYQLVPGHEWVKSDWPDRVYFTVIGSVGAAAGILGAQRRWLGAICGALAGVLTLWVYSTALSELPRELPRFVVAAVGVLTAALGFLPAILLYGVVNAVLPKLPDPPPEPEPARCPNPKCLSKKGWNGSVCSFCGTKAEPPATDGVTTTAPTTS